MKSFVLIALLVCLLAPINAVYFMVTEGQERCFIEEVPEETLVVGRYKSPDQVSASSGGSNENTAVVVKVKNPNQEIVLTHVCDAEGRFAFTSHVGGEHLVCLSTNTSHWFGTTHKFRYYLKLDVGESAVDYQAVAKLEHLSAIEVEIRKLNDKVKAIRSEQHYQRVREEVFRNTSESTNSRVMWWSIFQTVVLVGSGVWQILHLKRFFQQKKLV